MYYGFESRNQDACVGALLVYGLYRSRDMKKFKVTPDMWGIISRATAGCAFRSVDLWDFIEKMKPKLHVSELKPKWMKTGDNPVISIFKNPLTGELYQRGGNQEDRREFWTDPLETVDHEVVLEYLAKRTSLIIALVRDRLEREKPYEEDFERLEEEMAGESDVDWD